MSAPEEAAEEDSAALVPGSEEEAEKRSVVLLHQGPLPTRRAHAIRFKYHGNGTDPAMRSQGMMVGSPRIDTVKSTAYRDLHSLPTERHHSYTYVADKRHIIR